MNNLDPGTIYEIELCSGEIRRWLYIGADQCSLIWWKDMETGLEFNESSVMYAWTPLRKIS
ncbi:MAG: hypothetical protein ACM3SV_09430 [Betaproteobacteria bacterium]